jgi:hypothetical protein
MKPVWIKKGKNYVRIPYNVLSEFEDGTWGLLIPKDLVPEERLGPVAKLYRSSSIYGPAIKFLEEHRELFECIGSAGLTEVWRIKR